MADLTNPMRCRANGFTTLAIMSLALSSCSPASSAAQIFGRRGARVSPHETAHSIVDGATIDITYGRPFMRGRKIFGGLVPYGRVWMPGADEATIFTTSSPLRFSRVLLPAGSYSLYTSPSEAGWRLIINTLTGQWHTLYRADQDFTRLEMTLDHLAQPVEQLTIAAVARDGGGGQIQLEWESTRVSTPFTVER